MGEETRNELASVLMFMRKSLEESGDYEKAFRAAVWVISGKLFEEEIEEDLLHDD